MLKDLCRKEDPWGRFSFYSFSSSNLQPPQSSLYKWHAIPVNVFLCHSCCTVVARMVHCAMALSWLLFSLFSTWVRSLEFPCKSLAEEEGIRDRLHKHEAEEDGKRGTYLSGPCQQEMSTWKTVALLFKAELSN